MRYILNFLIGSSYISEVSENTQAIHKSVEIFCLSRLDITLINIVLRNTVCIFFYRVHSNFRIVIIKCFVANNSSTKVAFCICNSQDVSCFDKMLQIIYTLIPYMKIL